MRDHPVASDRKGSTFAWPSGCRKGASRRLGWGSVWLRDIPGPSGIVGPMSSVTALEPQEEPCCGG